MSTIKIRPDVYWIGVNDRKTELFEGIWPIDEFGVTYNCYLIMDEKKALIDLVGSTKSEEFFSKVDELISLSDIDYIIINHMEPDHTGIIPTIKRIVPNATILGTEKMKKMMSQYYGIDSNVQVVADGDILSLGRKKLQFFQTPFIHWPETMVTYETTEKILFSCDAFGGYGAFSGTIFEDECKNLALFEREALRYYSNIVATFSGPVLKAIERLRELEIKIIAPSHGLIWRKNPGRIVELYKRWAECQSGKSDPGITLIFGSMYGNTEALMNAVAQGAAKAGVEPEIFDVTRTHVSHILPSLWTKSGIIVGGPTYEGKLFPPVASVLQMAALKHIRNKTAVYFGSFGWSGGALKEMKKIIENLDWNVLDSIEFKGGPTQDLLRKGEALGRNFAEKIKRRVQK